MSSAGCDLPAKTICTGRPAALRMRARRSPSVNTSSGRLYPVKRRAKPIVSASGSSSVPAATTRGMPTCSSVQRCRARSRTNVKRWRRSDCRTAHSSASGIARTPSHNAGSSWRSSQSAPRYFAKSSASSPAIHVGAWTPLVIDVTGRSSSVRSGHIGSNIARVTLP